MKIMLRTLVLLSVLLCSATAVAQNKIDEAVEHFSTLGSATFTSVVERNPQTHEVQKVVKVLTISGSQANSLQKAFNDERRSGNFVERKDEQGHTMTLSCESSPQFRIYMLRLAGHPVHRQAKCTIIVKMKQQ